MQRIFGENELPNSIVKVKETKRKRVPIGQGQALLKLLPFTMPHSFLLAALSNQTLLYQEFLADRFLLPGYARYCPEAACLDVQGILKSRAI